MAVSKELSRFTRDALAAGKTREEISEVLVASGWAASEVAEALGAWAETPFSPPVPRPQSMVTARDFFFYALMFGLMVFGAVYLVQLSHALIDRALDAESYRSNARIRWSMAVLIVTAPMFFWLAFRERRQVLADPALYRSAIRKWMMYLTLLLSAAVLLGDLVAVIYAFLNGDLTAQFLLKAVVVAVVAGVIFLFQLAGVKRGEAP